MPAPQSCHDGLTETITDRAKPHVAVRFAANRADQQDETVCVPLWLLRSVSGNAVKLWADLDERWGGADRFPFERPVSAQRIGVAENAARDACDELLAVQAIIRVAKGRYMWNDGVHPRASHPSLVPSARTAAGEANGSARQPPIIGAQRADGPATDGQVPRASHPSLVPSARSLVAGARNGDPSAANSQVSGPAPSDPPPVVAPQVVNHLGVNHHLGVGVQGEGVTAAFEAIAGRLNGLAGRYRREGLRPRLAKALTQALAERWTPEQLAAHPSLTAAPWPEPLASVTGTIASRVERLGPPPPEGQLVPSTPLTAPSMPTPTRRLTQAEQSFQEYLTLTRDQPWPWDQRSPT